MPAPQSSSRRRYRDYLKRFRERQRDGGRSTEGEEAQSRSPHGRSGGGGQHGGGHSLHAHAVPMADGQSTRRQRSFFTLFMAFLSQTRGHNRMLALSLTASAVATLLGLVPLYGTKVVFDYVLGDQPWPAGFDKWLPNVDSQRDLLIAVCVVMVGFALISLALHMWSRWHATRITKRVQMDVRRRLFKHAVRLPLHRVYEIKSGGVASTLREDAGSVGDLVFAMLYNPWRAIIQLGGSLIILAFTDWRLLLGSVLVLPIVYTSVRLWVRRIRPMFRDIRATRSHIDGHATEAFGGIRVVRGFGRQDSEAQRFTRNNHFMARQELHVWWWNRAIDIAFSILIPSASAALLLVGGLFILDHRAAVDAGSMNAAQAFTTGDLVMFLAYLGWLLGPLALLASSATGFQNGLAGLDRVLDLMGERRELTVHDNAVRVSPDTVRGRITVRDVSFTYPNTDKPVLHDINLDVAAGEMVAFVGPSGAGKTTLSNLIARFFDPTHGVIELDGRDLRDIEVDSYRSLLGIVEQDIFLFDGTVAQNIAYGRRGATLEQIRDAAEQANAHTFVAQFADGYDTWIGERGVKLSGGQRQRIAIARAILADPRILILDEATSNLDTDSERMIQTSLQTLMQGRTSFVIAHRLSTIAHADRIVVIDEGRIMEQGKHDDLLENLGPYRHMVEMQTHRPAEQEKKEPWG